MAGILPVKNKKKFNTIHTNQTEISLRETNFMLFWFLMKQSEERKMCRREQNVSHFALMYIKV